jgi:hypothetical protein
MTGGHVSKVPQADSLAQAASDLVHDRAVIPFGLR